MERFEQAMARQEQAKYREQMAQQPIVTSVNDIKRVIAMFDPSNRLNKPIPNTNIQAQLVGSTDDNRKATFNLSASSASKTERDIIMDGINALRRRKQLLDKVEAAQQPMTVNGVEMKSAPLINTDGALGIDPIIRRATGGYRKGEAICWDLSDGYTYKYDIFQHKLTRFKRESDE